MLCVSAKTGVGVTSLLAAVVALTPPPTGRPSGLLRAALVDSWYDDYRGVICLVQVVDGGVRPRACLPSALPPPSPV